VFACVSLCVCMCESLCLHVWVFVCMCESLCLHVWVSVFACVSHCVCICNYWVWSDPILHNVGKMWNISSGGFHLPDWSSPHGDLIRSQRSLRSARGVPVSPWSLAAQARTGGPVSISAGKLTAVPEDLGTVLNHSGVNFLFFFKAHIWSHHECPEMTWEDVVQRASESMHAQRV